MDDASLSALRAAIAADEPLQQRLAAADDPAELGAALIRDGVATDGIADLLDALAGEAVQPPTWVRPDAPPRQWLPVQLFHDGTGLRIEWLHFAFAALTEPFFEQSVARARTHPLNLLLRCATPVDAVLPFASAGQPDGLVFHISRCGSTLAGQMFGALGDTIVLAEPPPLDAALRLYCDQVLPAPVVQGIAGALGRDRLGTARHRVIKLDAWHSPVLARVAGLFPAARSLFLFRDPLEVLVSQRARPGMHVRRGAVPLASFGLAGDEGIADADYAAWVIGGIMRGGLAAAGRPGLRYCDYTDLAASFATSILPHFGIAADEAALARVAEAGGRYSKDPQQAFVADAAAKQEAADAALRAQAEAFGLVSTYRELARLAQGNTPPRPPFAPARAGSAPTISVRFGDPA